MPQTMPPLPPPTTPKPVYFSAACPECTYVDATWRHRLTSSRREFAIFCDGCDLKVAWNPASGTEVAV